MSDQPNDGEALEDGLDSQTHRHTITDTPIEDAEQQDVQQPTPSGEGPAVHLTSSPSMEPLGRDSHAIQKASMLEACMVEALQPAAACRGLGCVLAWLQTAAEMHKCTPVVWCLHLCTTAPCHRQHRHQMLAQHRRSDSLMSPLAS